MEIEILGNIQDGGVPHLGCNCKTCEEARENPKKQKYCTSILLREDEQEDSIRYLIDASPDMRFQIKGDYLDGVFVPHESLGHITGLLYFGEEGIDSEGLNVYCNDHVENFLMKNDPYRFLIDRENIEIHNFEHKDTQKLQGGEIKAQSIHHPQLNHDTTAYIIKGEEKTLYYLSDITEWTENIKKQIKKADIALIDGTFWNEDEIDRYEEVPHPTIQSTIEEMKEYETEIHFIHINHTNPVLQKNSEERNRLEDQGFNVAEKGQKFQI